MLALSNNTSMRPRVFPAEDSRKRAADTAAEPLTSMRPRVFPAEDYMTPEDMRSESMRLQ